MKAIKFIFAFFIFSCIFAGTVSAQAVVEKDQNWTYYGYVSYDSHEVLTPDGTVNLRVNFKFDLTHPMIVQAILTGEYSIEVWAYSSNGAIPSIATFYPNGRVKVIGHREP